MRHRRRRRRRDRPRKNPRRAPRARHRRPLLPRTSMTRVDRAWFVAVIIPVCLGAAAPLARAQSAEAEALFRDGRALIKAGKLASGCDRLAASERLESSVGTLLNLGDCREKLGKL